MAATASGYETTPRPAVSVIQAPVAKTADYTVTTSDVGKLFSNLGASGTVVFTLPAISGWAGDSIRFTVKAAQIIRLLPQTGEKIFLDGDGVATKYLNVAAVIGNAVEVYNNGTSIEVKPGFTGVVTKEA